MPWDEALVAWRDALGSDHVIVDVGERAAAEQTTFATTQRIPAILRPGSREEVQQCLRIARAHGVSVHPVSRGKNWGYGSRVPPRDGIVLLELGRMNRIVEHDEELAYLTVEPGVTFEQAHAYLREKGSRLVLAAIGGPPQASLVGNALQRGDGAGLHGDAFSHVCGLEVVLPDGECLHTGLARFPGAKAAAVHRWGVGPSLDGLFSQSSLGVVTRMTLWLAVRAAFYRELWASVGEEAQLGALVDRLRELLLEGTLRGTVYLWNDYKVLSVLQQYPYEAVGGRTPLPAWVLEELRGYGWAGPWNASGMLHAPSDAQGLAALRRVKAGLRGVVKRLRFRRGEQGVPSPGNLAMTYWRKRSPVPERVDPDRDRCGFLWVACAVPFRGKEAAEAARLASEVPRLFAFEPNLSFIGISPRCLYLVAALAYDREVPGEDARALACHDALMRELAAAGYYPCRLGIQSARVELPEADGARELLRALERALDPSGVLARGRGGF